MNILLIQLGSNGDCLFVTTIARQIKEVDFPGCRLTWMIASSYKQVLANNPYIDAVIEVEAPNREVMIEQRSRIPQLIEEAGRQQQFDEVFVTDFSNNTEHWYGTTRSCLFRNYPKRISVDVRPDMFLSEEEIQNVAAFCAHKDITEHTLNILVESAPQSGQSKMNTLMAMELGAALRNKYPQLRFIISTKEGIKEEAPHIIDGSSLTWRENAALINHCHLLVGCSSGISWLATSRACKTIPFIQSIDPGYWGQRLSASFIDDYTFFNIDASHIIELHNPSAKVLLNSIECVIEKGIAVAKRKYRSSVSTVFSNPSFLEESYLSAQQKKAIKNKLQLQQPLRKMKQQLQRVQHFLQSLTN